MLTGMFVLVSQSFGMRYSGITSVQVPCLQCMLTYSLEGLGFYLVNTNSIDYVTRRLNAAFTRAIQWYLSWAKSTQFLVLIPISLRYILILSYHLRLGLPTGLFTVDFPVKVWKHSYIPPLWLHDQLISIFLISSPWLY